MIASVWRSGQVAERRWLAPVGGLILAVITLGQHIAASQPADQPNPLALLTHLYTLLLVLGLVWLAAAVGSAALRLLAPPAPSRREHWVFSLALGFGIVAYAILGLGLVGLLRAPLIVAVLAGLAILVRRELVQTIRAGSDLVQAVGALRRELRSRGGVIALAVPATEMLTLATVLSALAPPIGYDALMYHLQGPRRFLELGRIAVLPDVQQANMPLTVDLLYLVGLALGSQELANLLHVALAAIVVGAVYSFGREFLDQQVALLATLVFLSSTAVAVFAPMANIDYGLALFDFLAVYAFARWLRSQDRRYLLLSGVLVGFALGSKYLGGITGLALGLALVVTLAHSRHHRSSRQAVALILTYGVPAALIAAPWYLKNLLWLGSPVWPFLVMGTPPYNIAISANANLGRGIVDYLLLPIRVYVGEAHEYALARPSLLFLLLPLYPLLPKHRVITALLALGLVHVAIWTQGAHVVRYLTTATPELSLATAYVLTQLARSSRPRVGGRQLADTLIVVGLASTATVALAMAIFIQPFGQLVGVESSQAFLERNLPNHRLVAHLNGQGDAVRGVLLLGDRRGFYVQAPTWIDISLGALETLGTAPDAEAARAYLDGLGVSHVLVSAPDVAWHARYDPAKRIHGWWAGFERGRSEYLTVEATYFDLAVYRVERSPDVARRPGDAGEPGAAPD